MDTSSRLNAILGTESEIISDLSLEERTLIIMGVINRLKPSLKYLKGSRDFSSRFSRARQFGWDVRNDRIVSFPDGINHQTRVFRLYHHDKPARGKKSRAHHPDDTMVFNLLLTDVGLILSYESYFRTIRIDDSLCRDGCRLEHPVRSATVRLIREADLASIVKESYAFTIILKTLSEIVLDTIKDREDRLSCMREVSADLTAIMRRLSTYWEARHGESQD